MLASLRRRLPSAWATRLRCSEEVCGLPRQPEDAVNRQIEEALDEDDQAAEEG